VVKGFQSTVCGSRTFPVFDKMYLTGRALLQV
jgi:hypothetical protein